MAIFRKIHTSFWSDSFIQSLSPEQKYFFLYLLTNEKTKQCGIYDISKRHISFDTGYNIDTVSTLLNFFISAKKIVFSEETNELAIKNWDKYNGSNSPSVQSCIDEELINVKNRVLIEYVHSVHRVDTLARNKNKNKNKNKRDFSAKKEIQKIQPAKDEVPDYTDKTKWAKNLRGEGYSRLLTPEEREQAEKEFIFGERNTGLPPGMVM